MDFYAVLGVLPTADDVVIRAAYKALAQRYHPDKWTGAPNEANERMMEINAAYEVLSNRERRRQYDANSTRDAGSNPYCASDSRDNEPLYDPLKEQWEIAVSVYPDLVALNGKLQIFSWRVAAAFRAYLLESKMYEERKLIATRIEREYLSRYFGTNTTVQDYAKRLLLTGNRQIATELNRVVVVMGSNIDPSRIISLIEAKFRPFDDIVRPIRDDEEDADYRQFKA
jgi:curved DNA-binding protein CbpA